MAKIPSRGVDQFVLRFPDGLREQIRQLAEQSGRSMNAEIIARLEQTLSGVDVGRLQGENEALRANFAVLAEQLAGPVGQNREEVIRVLSALRVLGKVVPDEG
jgi:hypothetical protein